MPTKTLQTFLPYREAHTGEIKYVVPPSSTSSPSSPSTDASTRLYNTYLSSNYDSDNEPLIPTSSTIIPSELNEYDLQHFTATGRPAPTSFRPSTLASLDMWSQPQLLPQRYTDDSIIPAIIVDVIPSPSLHPPKPRKNSLSLLGKLKPGSLKGGHGGAGKEEKGIMKVAFMPRREYLKFFARGLEGEYIGSEPYRRWTEEELEREFGMYKPASMQKKGGRRKR